jgi:uncharacterized RDD family membrane protein YckC
MQGSAQFPVGEAMAGDGLLATGLATGTDGATLFDLGSTSGSLREAAAARVAAHRSRRAGAQAGETVRDEAQRLERERGARRGSSRVRDAVRARYESTQSYREFLAAEAERAIEQARAEAEVAARSARAIAEAQMRLLEELEQQERPFAVAPSQAEAERDEFTWQAQPGDRADEPEIESGELFSLEAPHSARAERPMTEVSAGGLTVRLYDDGHSVLPVMAPQARAGARMWREDPLSSFDELEELEQEIAFRRAPEFGEHILETQPLPANLIEFPRELVASRKARPRLAEGPLREELAPEPQLRIFEVEPEQISTEPVKAEAASDEAPMWQGMMLDASPENSPAGRAQARPSPSLADIAPISRRLMAAAVDTCCVGMAMVGFVTVAAWISGPRLAAMSRPLLGVAAVLTFATAALLYQVLFFTLNEATPGMRYARIALCTFAQESPTRPALRRRVIATVLAACPLALGLVWAWMDGDRLGWHDRISRMYQRAY